MMKQVRFWVFLRSEPVLIKLAAGQTLHHSFGGQTDEGWCRESNIWEFDGVTITWQSINDGVDCDGRLTRENTLATTPDKLRHLIDSEFRGVTYPAWDQVKSGQRDYSAEAMGY